MALQVKSKKGGPYTKQEQEKRRKQVYELHFEKGSSAVSIANELDVNRNTINEDIKFWQMQIASQLEDEDESPIVMKCAALKISVCFSSLTVNRRFILGSF